MSDSDKIAIGGIVVNVIIAIFNAAVLWAIAKKTIQATLQQAQPAAIAKARHKKNLTRNEWIRIFRFIQYLTVSSGLTSGVIDCVAIYELIEASFNAILIIVFILIGLIGKAGSVVLFIESHRIVRRLKAGDRKVLAWLNRKR